MSGEPRSSNVASIDAAQTPKRHEDSRALDVVISKIQSTQGFLDGPDKDQLRDKIVEPVLKSILDDIATLHEKYRTKRRRKD